MRRRRTAAVSAAIFAAAAVAGALGARGSDGGDAYLVRAIFDNASFVTTGEDVKVSGVVVGSIHALDVTPDHQAAVVLRIDDPAFRPFRADAHCRVGLQSLIGEQFVECEPTTPRGGDRAAAPALPRIASGPGAGQHLLPIGRTSSPVGADLLNAIMRVPQRQRLPLIINEFGAGLAGNGEGLRAAIRRASPALQQADRLVATLAAQNRTLARLVDESDTVLGPLAVHRKDVTGFVRHAGETATATAQEGDALEASFARFPAFLRELGPAADRLGALADQTTPTIDALAAQAPAVTQATARLGPLARQATPALKTLGDVADRGRRTFPQIEQLVTRLDELGVPLAPLAQNLGALSSSFDDTGGIESLMRFIYFYTGSVNGEDASGHYTRAGIGPNNCIDRAPAPVPGCSSKYFTSAASAATARASSGTAGQLLDYLLAP
jgi:ABC-type transporter Mla subunit MlaD